MASARKKIVASFLIAVLMISLIPQCAVEVFSAVFTAAAERSAIQALERLPEGDFTPAQIQNADEIALQLIEAGGEAREGHFRYRLLGDGCAAITGYDGPSGSVEVPRTLDGADVVAIAAGAFGAEVTELSAHGNVLYLEVGAVSRGTVISAFQGSFAAAWAQRNGYVLRSLTEGVLYAGVVDLTDVLDRVKVLSDSLVSVGAVEARRLTTGDTFILNRGDNDEQFFTVTGMRDLGGRVYLTVRRAEVTGVYRYRLYEGERRITKTFTDTQEVGVDQAAEEVRAAAFEDKLTKTNTPTNVSVKFPLGKTEISITYKNEMTVTAAYRIEVENGEVTARSTMNKQTESKNTLEVKLKISGKIVKFEAGDPVGYHMSDQDLMDMLELVKRHTGKKEEKLSSFMFYVLPSLGIGFEIAPFVSWEAGGSGSLTWTSRLLELYNYNAQLSKWYLYDKRSLDAPDPTFTGKVYAKVGAGVKVSMIVGWVTTEMRFKAEAALKFTLSVPVNQDLCTSASLHYTDTFTFEAGLWLTMGKFEIGGSSASATVTLRDITLYDIHCSKNQGLHAAWQCNKAPMDYCFRFVTNSESWHPASMSFLNEG